MLKYKKIHPIDKDDLAINDAVNHPTSELFNSGLSKSSNPYEETMPSPFIFPRIMVDYKTVKPGFYFYTGEVLDKLANILKQKNHLLWL